ncbi:3144_t:CDS:2, partial [Gigaspora margarita]
MDIDQIYDFEKGWALKGNQKYCKKGGGKRIKKKVKQLLITSGEVEKKDVQNWINTYSAEFKEQALSDSYSLPKSCKKLEIETGA